MQQITAIAVHAEKVWRSQQGAELLPRIEIAPDISRAVAARREGALAIVRAEVPALRVPQGAARDQRDARATALVQVLTAFGLLEDRSYDEQQLIVQSILQIFAEGSPT